jgi:hypothetical protein
VATKTSVIIKESTTVPVDIRWASGRTSSAASVLTFWCGHRFKAPTHYKEEPEFFTTAPAENKTKINRPKIKGKSKNTLQLSELFSGGVENCFAGKYWRKPNRQEGKKKLYSQMRI